MSVSAPPPQNQGLHTDEEEFGVDPSLGTRCGEGLGAQGGKWVPAGLVWGAVGEKLKKEVLEDGGDRLGGKEKWEENDGNGGEVAYVEKEGENQGEEGGER